MTNLDNLIDVSKAKSQKSHDLKVPQTELLLITKALNKSDQI